MQTLAVSPVHAVAPWAGEPGTIDFLDWMIDGISLRELTGAGGGNMSLLQGAEWLQRHQVESLRRLKGEQLPAPTYEPTFHRTRIERLLRRRGTPVAAFGAAFEDGRVGLLFCFCGDIDCPTLSARVVVDEDTVEWREIGWQVGYEPFVPDPAATFAQAVFERASYDALIDGLLSAAESRIDG